MPPIPNGYHGSVLSGPDPCNPRLKNTSATAQNHRPQVEH
jgi:hypothetical protein